MSIREILQMLNKSDIVFLWAAMGEMYGSKWTSQYPEIDVNKVWINALNPFNAQVIKQALETCLVSYPDWPPTLPQFRFLCLGFPTKTEAARLIHKPNLDNAFIRAMRYRIGDWNLSNMTLKELGPLINAAYDDVIQVYSDLATNGRLLNAPFKRIEHG